MFGAALSDEEFIKKPYRLADLAVQVERVLAAPGGRLPGEDAHGRGGAASSEAPRRTAP